MHILVIHGDLTFLHFADVLLSRAGHHVTLLSSPSRLLSTWQAQRPDLLIVDYGLRDGGIQDIIDRLAVIPGGASSPILICMEHGGPASNLSAMLDSHQYQVLQEPITGQRVLTAINDLLQ